MSPTHGIGYFPPRTGNRRAGIPIPLDTVTWLRAYRQARNLTWDALAAEFKAEDLALSMAALYGVLREGGKKRCFERTVNKLTTFVRRREQQLALRKGVYGGQR